MRTRSRLVERIVHGLQSGDRPATVGGRSRRCNLQTPSATAALCGSRNLKNDERGASKGCFLLKVVQMAIGTSRARTCMIAQQTAATSESHNPSARAHSR